VAENLLAQLVPEGVDDYELLYLLQRHYGSGGVGEPNQVVYPSSLNYSLRVRWKDGRVIQIERGPAGFSAEECDALKNKIQTTLIDSPGETIRTAVFSRFRVAYQDTSELLTSKSCQRPLRHLGPLRLTPIILFILNSSFAEALTAS